MRADEFELFKSELKQLCAALGKSYTDALGEAYWRSLQDVELDEVQAHVERVLLNASKDTKFPRPAELRTTPAPRHVTALESDPSLKEALARNKANLDDLIQRAPVAAKWHVLSAYLARIDVEEEASSAFHAERFRWAQDAAQKLVREHGEHWCTHDTHIMHAASRLLGGTSIGRKSA